ncbi:MAG TPA: hypothetical protein VMF68_16215 [Spirochaetia bacterium]|nr:hypothetical protein [Spirochaetia bacterium]HTZ53214.1 hypothetical protein [Spirochaetia bacterium]
MAQLDEFNREVWSDQSIFRVENHIINNIFACRTTDAVEAAITYAAFLRKSGLTNENYPLFMKLLEMDNHFVIDSLLGTTDPFLFLTPIQPTKHLVSTCFRLLTNWHPGGIYPKTLAIVLGALQAAYSYAKDGYKIHTVAINDVNNLGKHLNKEKGQDESVNRAILDILDRLASLEGQGDDEMELIARQCNVIRGNYFDKRRKMEDAIPQVLLVKSDYLVKEVLPAAVFED